MSVAQVTATLPTRTSPEFGVWKSLAIAAAFSLLAIAVVYPGMLFRADLPISTDPSYNDLWDQNLPLRVWGANEIARGHLPLWFPGCYGGVPLASLPEAVPYYFPSSLFYLAMPPMAATAGTIVFHLLIAGIGAALLARHFGASISGQIMAAILMSVGLHLPMHVRQLNILQSDAWIPLVWLFVDRIVHRPDRRNVAGLGFSMGMLGLAGHPEILHHTCVILCFWGLIRLFGIPERHDLRFWVSRVSAVAGAAVIAIAVAAPSLMPIMEISRLADRSKMVRFTPPFDALCTLFDPLAFDDPRMGVPPNNRWFKFSPWEQIFYMGLLPLGIALFYIWRQKKSRICRELLFIAAISLFFAYAPRWGVTRWISDLIPMQSASRFPHRYFWFFYNAMVILAALGVGGFINFVYEKHPIFSRRPVRIAFVLVLIFVSLYDIHHATRKLNPFGHTSVILEKPATLAPLEKAGASPNAFGERLANYQKPIFLTTAFMVRDGWNFIPKLELELHRFFIGEHPALWNWPVLDGYVGIVPVWSAYVLGSQHVHGMLPGFDNDSARLKDFVRWSGLYGGRWLASPGELKSPDLKLIDAIGGEYFTVRLYENRLWPGPAWISRKIQTFSDDQKVVEGMIREGISKAPPDKNVVRLTNEFMPKGATEDAASQTADQIGAPVYPDPEHVTFECQLAKPGFLVINQSWHPRWRVRIDGGRPIRPARVNVVQSGVWLDAGTHRVAFEFPGTLEKACIAAGVIGLIAALACAIGPRIRRSRDLDSKPVA